jgi:murein DD-endopeptidase MepM/ murein hydrolase activator NlpD
MVKKTLFIAAISFVISACATEQLLKEGPRSEEDIPIGHSDGCWLSDYAPASESQYVLPYTIGNSYIISQGNCGQLTHTKPPTISGDIRYAYDFALPIGDKIVASRSGEVINVEDFYNNHSFDNYKTNFILIKHDDATIAAYIHLSPSGSLVEKGDYVEQGQLIGVSGQSGYAIDPHLHFEVFEKEHEDCILATHIVSDKKNYRLSGCKTIPITFKNADPLDTPPRNGTIYTAVKY